MFEKAIRHFAARIKKAHQRAHIFISSCPYAWRARTDGDLLERLLPYKKPKSEPTEDAENVAEESVNNESGAPESALRVYLLDPLSEDDIRIFAEHRNAPKVDRLVKNCPASRWSLHKRRVLMVAVAKSRK